MEHGIQQDSSAWIFFVKVCFGIAVVATAVGIYFLPVDYWAKGYIGMGMFFLVGSTLMLSKTMRDEHEAKKIINQIKDVKTEKLLKEYEGE